MNLEILRAIPSTATRIYLKYIESFTRAKQEFIQDALSEYYKLGYDEENSGYSIEEYDAEVSAFKNYLTSRTSEWNYLTPYVKKNAARYYLLQSKDITDLLKNEHGITTEMIHEAKDFNIISEKQIRSFVNNYSKKKMDIKPVNMGGGCWKYKRLFGQNYIDLLIDYGTWLPGFDYWLDIEMKDRCIVEKLSFESVLGICRCPSWDCLEESNLACSINTLFRIQELFSFWILQ